MIIISSDPKLSRVASQIKRSVTIAKSKTQFIPATTPSRLSAQFISISRRSETSLTKPKNRKIYLSLILLSLFSSSSAFAVVVNTGQVDWYSDPTDVAPSFTCVDYTSASKNPDAVDGHSWTSGYPPTPSGLTFSLLSTYPNLTMKIDSNTIATNTHLGAVYSSGIWYGSVWFGLKCTKISSCPINTFNFNGICRAPVLSDYNNDPQNCDKYGGYYYSSGVVASGGTNYTIPLLFGSSISLKSNYAMVTHCGTFTDMAGQVASNILPMLSMVIPAFRSSKLFKLARYAFSQDMQTKLLTSPLPTAKNDFSIGLPKLPPPASPSMKSVVPIVEKPIPTSANSSGTVGPSREPEVTVDPNYANIDDSYIPATTAGDPIVDYSVVDRFNSLTSATSSTATMADVVPQVGTTSLPVKESFDFSKLVQNSSIPNDVASVPATTTKSVSFSGQDPIDSYTTVKNYPDGSSLSQVVKINRATKQGYVSSTTLASSGESSTLNFPISVPTYNGVLSGADIIKPPVNQTFATPTTSPTTPNTVTPSASVPTVANTMTNPDAISAQDPTTIINAKMPNYSFPVPSDITLFSVDSINQLNTNFSSFFDNINSQIGTVGTTFNTTKSLISGGWTPPIIPQGACGTFMAFDFHNKHVDLCPPMAQQVSKMAPLITLLLTIAGIYLAIKIYLNALRD